MIQYVFLTNAFVNQKALEIVINHVHPKDWVNIQNAAIFLE